MSATRLRELAGLELTRPYYAHLFRMEQQFPEAQQCQAFKEALAAHRVLEDALTACTAPGPTERDALVLVASMLYTSAVCDGTLEYPENVSEPLGPRLAPFLTRQQGTWLFILPGGVAALACLGPVDILKVYGALVAGFIDSQQHPRQVLGLAVGLAEAVENASHHPAWEAALQQLGTPLTLPLLRHLAQREAHTMCKTLVNRFDLKEPPPANAVSFLRASAQR